MAAQKNVQKAQSQYNKDIENENKKLAKDERNANNHLAKAQREFSKQKGRKSEGKARENLAKDQFAAVRVSKEHDKRLQQLGQKTSNELGKNSRNLEKGLTKAHNDNFDANGKAKQHLNSEWRSDFQVVICQKLTSPPSMAKIQKGSQNHLNRRSNRNRRCSSRNHTRRSFSPCRNHSCKSRYSSRNQSSYPRSQIRSSSRR